MFCTQLIIVVAFQSPCALEKMPFRSTGAQQYRRVVFVYAPDSSRNTKRRTWPTAAPQTTISTASRPLRATSFTSESGNACCVLHEHGTANQKEHDRACCFREPVCRLPLARKYRHPRASGDPVSVSPFFFSLSSPSIRNVISCLIFSPPFHWIPTSVGMTVDGRDARPTARRLSHCCKSHSSFFPSSSSRSSRSHSVSFSVFSAIPPRPPRSSFHHRDTEETEKEEGNMDSRLYGNDGVVWIPTSVGMTRGMDSRDVHNPLLRE